MQEIGHDAHSEGGEISLDDLPRHVHAVAGEGHGREASLSQLRHAMAMEADVNHELRQQLSQSRAIEASSAIAASEVQTERATRLRAEQMAAEARAKYLTEERLRLEADQANDAAQQAIRHALEDVKGRDSEMHHLREALEHERRRTGGLLAERDAARALALDREAAIQEAGRRAEAAEARAASGGLEEAQHRAQESGEALLALREEYGAVVRDYASLQADHTALRQHAEATTRRDASGAYAREALHRALEEAQAERVELMTAVEAERDIVQMHAAKVSLLEDRLHIQHQEIEVYRQSRSRAEREQMRAALSGAGVADAAHAAASAASAHLGLRTPRSAGAAYASPRHAASGYNAARPRAHGAYDEGGGSEGGNDDAYATAAPVTPSGGGGTADKLLHHAVTLSARRGHRAADALRRGSEHDHAGEIDREGRAYGF